VDTEGLEETEAHQHRIEHLLSERFGVRHLTLHFETPAMSERHQHRFMHEHEAENDDHDDHHGHHEGHGHD